MQTTVPKQGLFKRLMKTVLPIIWNAIKVAIVSALTTKEVSGK